MTKSLFRPLFWGIFLPVNLLSTSICDIPNPQYEIASAEITRNHACWNFWKRMGDCLQWWLVPVFVTLHSAKYWMKAPKLVITKKSQLKVPVTTAGRKMQIFRNSNRCGQNFENFYSSVLNMRKVNANVFWVVGSQNFKKLLAYFTLFFYIPCLTSIHDDWFYYR